MNWRDATAIVWLGFSLGALTDTALRAPAAPGHSAQTEVASTSSRADADTAPAASRNDDTASGHRATESSSRSRPAHTDDNVAVATNGVAVESAVDALRRRDLDVPVEGVHRKDLRDTFTDTRAGARAHEALDVMAARRTPVRAVEDGVIEKLFTSKAGGLTIYQFEPSQTFCYYYAHLDAYAPGLHEGQSVKKGDLIGYVGSTGNASPDAPHLHFAIFRLTPERQWWKGEPINPYAVLR